jgi:phosphotriesterase-related protein
VKIETVLGAVSPASLGSTSFGEHLMSDAYWITGFVDYLLNDEGLAVQELAAYRQAGGGTLVEPTNVGLRRNPQALVRIAQASGVNVVMGCGWYCQRHYPPELERRSTGDLAQEMVRDLTLGVGDAGIRAGIIGEIGVTSDYVSAGEERVLRAAARAHHATGAAILVSSNFHPIGLQQLELLGEERVDLRRVIVGHADTYLESGYHEAIVKQGACVAFDNVGKAQIYPDERRCSMLKSLVDLGFGDRIVLGNGISRRSELHAYGGTGYDFALEHFLPMLRQAGIAEEQLQQMTVVTPARVLSGES